jgi:DNA-directed RNA polymerase subunit omega
MARITVEDCLQKVNNRFTIIHMAAKRVRQIRKGAEPSIMSKNKDIVVSLREIAAGNVMISESGADDHLLGASPELLIEGGKVEASEEAAEVEEEQ